MSGSYHLSIVLNTKCGSSHRGESSFLQLTQNMSAELVPGYLLSLFFHIIFITICLCCACVFCYCKTTSTIQIYTVSVNISITKTGFLAYPVLALTHSFTKDRWKRQLYTIPNKLHVSHSLTIIALDSALPGRVSLLCLLLLPTLSTNCA